MTKVLMAWVGNRDLNGAAGVGWVGPIAASLDVRDFDRAVLMFSGYVGDEERLEKFQAWIRGRTQAELDFRDTGIKNPWDFASIYRAAKQACQEETKTKSRVEFTFHLSPGTLPMRVSWMMLGKTIFPAVLINAWENRGVHDATVPFNIAAEFLPDLLKERDERLRLESESGYPAPVEFQRIIHRCQAMKRVVERARKVAYYSVPVLIEGETGTGKEEFAKAIHDSSQRKGGPFCPVNCGAIPENLVESELFGHVKGAFTGADKPHKGYFEQAHGGTLFLDEIGEMPLSAQVKLLRVLQEGEVTPIGAKGTTKVDVRVIAATNRSLIDEVKNRHFREDLYFRLAVGVLALPPLRHRGEDIGLLIDEFLVEVCREVALDQGDLKLKKLSVGARKLALEHSWPGNVRELRMTLKRAALWGHGETITLEELQDALISAPDSRGSDILGRPLGAGFSLSATLNEVARHYLERAMREAGGVKAQAAKLVGLKSAQTLTNQLRQCGIKL